MSDPGSPDSPEQTSPMPPPATNGTKRKQDQASITANGARPNKAVKRRASKACQCCRARKVRCNVVEQIPCTNCRLDEVECIVSESKRKKKWPRPIDDDGNVSAMSIDSNNYKTSVNGHHPPSAYPPLVSSDQKSQPTYNSGPENAATDGHRSHSFSTMRPPPPQPDNTSTYATAELPFAGAQLHSPPLPSRQLPPYLKPLPARIGAEEVNYLSRKGALTIPPLPLRNALLKCFLEFVHPYMPLVDSHDLIEAVDRNDGTMQVSLLVFQAIMFTGTAMVDIKLLRASGYVTRREARRDFFQKTRLLYDFDYEIDRISLIQALLLMTYWYETPDDQKDSHHWMGIAVSLSHTIGLHRNPERSTDMDIKQRRLWRRIWWSTYMRDRLISLGMRRPTRIKNEDFDVPMLTTDDFPIKELSRTTLSCIPTTCEVMYNASVQRQLATLCVEKAKLCICISHVLYTQYSYQYNTNATRSNEGSTRTTMMLVAKKDDPESFGVRNCDEELAKWKASIAPEADVNDPTTEPFESGDESVFLNKYLLHMIYYSTISALHRPQVLPSGTWPPEKTAADLLEISMAKVRFAANRITLFAERLDKLNLIRFLPTVGITVLLPAIIIHLLDIKALDESVRKTALQGFCQCMQIMSQLRDAYAAADYSTAFLEAAIRKAEIALPQRAVQARYEARGTSIAAIQRAASRGATAQKHQQHSNLDPLLLEQGAAKDLTPPPDAAARQQQLLQQQQLQQVQPPQQQQQQQRRATDLEVASRLTTFLTSTPPDSNGFSDGEGGVKREFVRQNTESDTDMLGMADFEPDFDALVNLDAAGEAFALDDADFAATLTGMDAGGFMSSDVNWMKGMNSDI